LSGTADVRYALTGLEAEFHIPAKYISAFGEGMRASSETSQTASARKAEGSRLSGAALILEDNMIIALDAEDILQAAGAEDVHVCSTVAEALKTISDNEISFALLDVNLGSETSEAVAQELSDRNISFIFASGYGDSNALTGKFPGITMLKKPYDQSDVEAAVKQALKPN
ncbi:MAG: hybrid sensor histidine kinase/response regulator, partial [Henriciella sp.]